MGDSKTLAKAKMELEELYLGIPDDSVDLTFQDLADVKQNINASEKKKSSSMKPIQEAKTPKQSSSLTKLPSLDFNKGLQASKNHHHHRHHLHHVGDGHTFDSHKGHGHVVHHHLHHDEEGMHASHGNHRYGDGDHQSHHGFRHAVLESSMAYDDVSVISMTSMYQGKGGRARRPGIPHSNICTICSTYIYIFRHRCLVTTSKFQFNS